LLLVLRDNEVGLDEKLMLLLLSWSGPVLVGVEALGADGRGPCRHPHLVSHPRADEIPMLLGECLAVQDEVPSSV
jgi:hypothetical protein